MRIGVYTILDNSAVEGWIEATQTADMRLVLAIPDWKATTHACLSDAGVSVHYGLSRVHWREDDALNTALTLLPPHIDVCFRVDMQDRPRPGWRSAIENACKDRDPTLALSLPQCGLKSYYEQHIHSRSGFRWSSPDRAALLWRGVRVPRTETTDELTVDYVPRAMTDLALLQRRLMRRDTH